MKSRTIAALALIAALTLTGCTAGAGSSAPDKPAPVVTEPAPEPSFAEPAEPAPEPEVDDMILGFGEAMTWIDNVSLSVSAPAAFQASEYAAGVIDGQAQVVFTLVLTNNSDAVLEPSTYARVSSGGQEASQIFDSGNPAGEIGGSPSTAILPGQTVQWLAAFSVADPAAITFQVAPSFEYEDAIFTNIAQ